MKIVLQLLFLLFYVASSYAATQQRTLGAMEECADSLSRASSEIGSETRGSVKSLPKFGQAKPRAGSDVWFAKLDTEHHLQVVLDKPEPLQECLKDLFTLERRSSRAPPFQV